jgi:hypothetical protein
MKIGFIGLSKIAAGYEDPKETHLGAILRANPKANLVCFDPDKNAQVAAKQRFGTIHIADELDALKCDVVLISSPTQTHYQHVTKALTQRHKPVVVCEKPLAPTYEQGRELVERADQSGQTLIVNFQRRWLPGVLQWCAAANQGQFGRRRASVFYVGPETRERFIASASHALDIAGACGVTAENIDVYPYFDFSVEVRCEQSSLTLRKIGDLVPVWENIFNHIAKGDSLPCRAADHLPGMKLVDELCPA